MNLTRRSLLAGVALPAFSRLWGKPACAPDLCPTAFDLSQEPVPCYPRLNADKLDAPLGQELAYDLAATTASLLAKGYELLNDPERGQISLAHFVSLHECMCSDQSTWNVHSTGAFALWHRAFLYFHERALNRLLIRHGFLRKDCLRLPFWYWDNPHSRAITIPSAYELPGLAYSPRGYKKGFTSRELTDLQRLPRYREFGCFSFWLQHNHKKVHDNFTGTMNKVSCSAVDPIFYAHHSNIDRILEVWSKNGKVSGCGSEAFFWNVAQDGSPVPMTVKLSQFETAGSESTVQLGYTFADVTHAFLPALPSIISFQFPLLNSADRWAFFVNLDSYPKPGSDLIRFLASPQVQKKVLGEISPDSDERKDRLNLPAYTLGFQWDHRPRSVVAVAATQQWRVLSAEQINTFTFRQNAPSHDLQVDDCAVMLPQCPERM